MIWYESGDGGSRTALLARPGRDGRRVKSVERALQERGTMRWLAADLSGHDGSDFVSRQCAPSMQTKSAITERHARSTVCPRRW